MKHYLVYHSAEKMGHSFRDDNGGQTGDYSIVTSKKPDNLPGNAIWLISGEGKPKDYRLEYWFIVDGFETITDPEFEAQVYGTDGYTFKGGVPITRLPWFRPFRERMANFSLGLSPLTDADVKNFTAAAKSAKGKIPT